MTDHQPDHQPDHPTLEDQLLLEKARVLGWLAGPVWHDLSNPLGGIVAFTTVLQMESSLPDDLAADVELVADAAMRAEQIALAFTELVRIRPHAVRTVPAAGPVRDAVAVLGYPLTGVDLAVDVPDSLPDLATDPASLREAVLFVAVDCLRAMGGLEAQGRLSITGAVADDGSAVLLAFDDSAPPVGAERSASLFEAPAPAIVPASGDALPRGGPTLAAARALLRHDGGDLRYEVRQDGGNRLVVAVPIGPPA